ncbi:MAG: acyltransferase family protein [Filimonas sp.]|nr:acyltransferase family protein [Filimonas sp.]
MQQKTGIAQALKNVAYIPVNFKLDATDHLWYLYMIIGLYLFMPVLSAWVEKDDRKAQRFFLIIWGYTLFLPYIKQWFPQLQGECDWNVISTTYYFTGFTGYLLLGHYLVKYDPVPAAHAVWVGIVLYIVGSLVTYFGFVHTTTVAGRPVEIAWWFTGPNVMAQTLGLFLVLKNVKVQSNALKRIATLTFGIYLAHYFIVRGIQPYIYNNIQALPAIKILITVCTASVLTYALVYLLSKLPGSKYFIG